MPAKKVLTPDKLVEAYIDYVLENDSRPKNVYSFCKHIKRKESEFYPHFGTFAAIESHVFQHLFNQTLEVVEADENYQDYDSKTKLLSFYFVFIENMTANRSFIDFTLNQGHSSLQGLKLLFPLKTHFHSFINTLELESLNIGDQSHQGLHKKVEKEVLWHHFLCVIQFWLKDDSANFEKTDTFIEKSINTGFELANIQPLESLFDLGKFLYKEMAR